MFFDRPTSATPPTIADGFHAVFLSNHLLEKHRSEAVFNPKFAGFYDFSALTAHRENKRNTPEPAVCYAGILYCDAKYTITKS